MCLVISTTQTKETVFDKFLFSSKDGGTPIWNLIVPEHIKYTFSVETDFIVKDSLHDKERDDSSEDDIIKRFNDNFFANVSPRMTV